MKKTRPATILALVFIAAMSLQQIAAGPVDEIDTWHHYELLEDGLDLSVIGSPPVPPARFAREAASMPELDKEAVAVFLSVPEYTWYMGAAATAGSMIAAYYDREGFPNIYTGPTNGGVMPMDDTSWPLFADVLGVFYHPVPLTGTRDGVDGRVGRGSSDDYWIQLDSAADDPWITNGWIEHAWGEAIGDYMKTSQSAYGNIDGATTFYGYNSAVVMTCDSLFASHPEYAVRDGTYGRKLFYEARGYTVTDCYYQKTDNQYAGGFSFAQYMAEIDAHHPVMINLDGHSLVGTGYNTVGNIVYLHDTWDRATHSMTWGDSYSGNEMRSVSIVNLAPLPPGAFAKTAPLDGAFVTTDPTLTWSASAGADYYILCFDTIDNNVCDTSWNNSGFTTSVTINDLSNNSTRYWSVAAVNGAGTVYADGGTWRSFTARDQRFADVPIDHQFWAQIEAIYSAGVTTGCGVGPLIYCPENLVTRAAMAVFLLRAKYGSGYTPPAAGHFFADMPVAGKEWQEAWVDQVYREGITTGCGAGPLIFCPENSVTRAAMAVFILRTINGPLYTPPAAGHFFADVPIAGKEWMEPWIDEFYRQGVTTGCGVGPLIYCPETAVRRKSMAAFLQRAFGLPMP